MPIPSGVIVDGQRYLVAMDAGTIYRPVYREQTQSVVRQQEAITGLSRPGRANRPDVMEYVLDDWSLGESDEFKFLDSTSGHPSQRGYFFSDGPVDIATPGQIGLGLNFGTASLDVAVTVTGGPHLTIAKGNVWVFFNATNQFWNGSVWTNANQTGASNWLGAPDGLNFVFAGTGSQLVRVDTASKTTWVSSGARSPTIANNRVFYGTTGTDKFDLREVPLQPSASAPFTPSVDATAGGDDTVLGTVAVGSLLYILVSSTNDPIRLYRWNGTALTEVANWQSLRINSSALRSIAEVNGAVFIGGWNKTTIANVGEVVFFIADQTKGSLGRIRENPDATGKGLVNTLARGKPDELLIGVLEAASGSTPTAAVMYRYDMRTGGLSQYGRVAAAETPTGLAYFDSQYFLATTLTGHAKVYRATTDTRFTSAVNVFCPIWNFDTPSVDKVFTEVIIEGTGNGTIDFAFFPDGNNNDGTTAVTTDKDGNTMRLTVTGAASSAKFQLSGTPAGGGAEVIRSFKQLQPRITLTGTDSTHGPVCTRITMRAMPTSKITIFEVAIDVRDQSTIDHPPANMLTGNKALKTLRTLRDSSTKRVFTFTPLFESAQAPHPGPTETTYDVVWATDQLSTDYTGTTPGLHPPQIGQGIFYMRVMTLGTT